MAIAITSASANAHQGEDHSGDKATTQTHEANDSESYNYKAQSGDSYSEMARKAIQTHGLEHNFNFSGAQIIFAETQITNEAKPGLLSVGQEVKISKALVKKYADKAVKLTDVQQKAWNTYVKFVDFNTNKVGQA